MPDVFTVFLNKDDDDDDDDGPYGPPAPLVRRIRVCNSLSLGRSLFIADPWLPDKFGNIGMDLSCRFCSCRERHVSFGHRSPWAGTCLAILANFVRSGYQASFVPFMEI